LLILSTVFMRRYYNFKFLSTAFEYIR